MVTVRARMERVDFGQSGTMEELRGRHKVASRSGEVGFERCSLRRRRKPTKSTFFFHNDSEHLTRLLSNYHQTPDYTLVHLTIRVLLALL